MSDQNEYHKYLTSRSRLGHIYRRYWLYPRLQSRLRGLTLDVGCGIGDMLEFRPGTVGVDINEYNVIHCIEKGMTAQVMKPNVLPFSDRAFDSVLLDNVLEHIDDPRPLLDEIHRVLNEHGTLVIGVPGIRGWYRDPDHKVLYDESGLIECMKGAGFDCVELFYAPLWRSHWLSKTIAQYCIYGQFDPLITKNPKTEVNYNPQLT